MSTSPAWEVASHPGIDIPNKESGKASNNNATSLSVSAIQAASPVGNGTAESILQRRLENRQVQLIAIGGSLGTALSVSTGEGHNKGGPGSLFLAYSIYSVMLSLANDCMAEMSIYMPISGGFIRIAGKWVDEAFGFMAGWNFYFYEALLFPFEIAGLNLVLSFWSDNILVGAICAACIVLYA